MEIFIESEVNFSTISASCSSECHLSILRICSPEKYAQDVRDAHNSGLFDVAFGEQRNCIFVWLNCARHKIDVTLLSDAKLSRILHLNISIFCEWHPVGNSNRHTISLSKCKLYNSVSFCMAKCAVELPWFLVLYLMKTVKTARKYLKMMQNR